MPTIATATVIGHLYGPAELKTNERGSYCRIRFWTSDKVKGQDEKKFTSWGGVVNGPQAEWMARDARKGALVAVSGTIRLDKFKKTDGTESYSIEFTRISEARVLEREGKPVDGEDVPSGPAPSQGASASDDQPPFAPLRDLGV